MRSMQIKLQSTVKLWKIYHKCFVLAAEMFMRTNCWTVSNLSKKPHFLSNFIILNFFLYFFQTSWLFCDSINTVLNLSFKQFYYILHLSRLRKDRLDRKSTGEFILVVFSFFLLNIELNELFKRLIFWIWSKLLLTAMFFGAFGLISYRKTFFKEL